MTTTAKKKPAPKRKTTKKTRKKTVKGKAKTRTRRAPLKLSLPPNVLDMDRCPTFANLDIKYQVFILHFLKHFNATKAAEAVGAPKSRSRQSGHDFVTNSDVQAALQEVASQVVQGEVADVQEILNFWTDVERSNLADFISWTKDGLVFTKDSNDFDRAKSRLLKKVKCKTKASAQGDWTESEVQVELHDPMKASELLAKYHDILNEKPEGDTNVTINIIERYQKTKDDGDNNNTA